ncbi:hypothetical protein [Polyangium sp. 6x1]|uniref:hypothetical protein n=1 Tax=Polyangium sp. 6x1 TaxID=3042689 RepID=UPI002482BDDE|nr:hypothetical protein [Polyangium sp. 6x1]MDI1443575.1 hypothetical protein [Polyangium sp. 6x1]
MSSTSLTIERYAEIRAEMEVGRLRDEVLARAGIGIDAWTAEQRSWLQKMSAELERGRFELTNRYTQAFLERQNALQAKSPAPAEAEPMEARTKAPAASPEVSRLQPRIPEPVRRDVVPLLPTSAAVASVSWQGGMPAAEAADAQAPAPRTAEPSAALPLGDLSHLARLVRLPAGTDLGMTLPPIQPAGAPNALPFQAGESARPRQPAAKPTGATTTPSVRARLMEPSRDDSVEDQAARTLPPGGLVRPALPFEQQQDENEDDPLMRTMFVSPEAAQQGPALPFQAKHEPGHDKGDDAANTSPSPPVPELSLEAHAALCAKLALAPGDAEHIFAAYGLASRDKRTTVDDAWKRRLQQDPKLYEQWQQLYRAFYAQWSAHRTR